ncbi:DUF4268 domain-containing protein [Paracoccus sp. KR1-242]|uniref:DUF4268 domain-containing protein n=1 Tax=Paracoccus sp. KR1-242 TaxID=3410028 RepID=UPI003C0C2D88
MFRVDRNLNRISPLSRKRFGELGFREREHLQEWLVHQPDALGEDLLIIQKEFDGFDETRERLDLLALDRDGNLVIIENKLDDSGRDVTWQALKYTAYVSALKTRQLVDIYQQYLDRYEGGGSAAQRICEFLEVEDISDAELNRRNTERLIFIAANFRKEVTATVLWLIGRGVNAKCFRVQPFSFGEEILLDLQQIIPPREAAEYMVNLAAKEVEESANAEGQMRRHDMRMGYWTLALQRMRDDRLAIFSNLSPSKNNWLWGSTGVSKVHFLLSFTQQEARVGLTMVNKDQAENKRLFDALHARKEEIEGKFGGPLLWLRKDDGIQSMIAASQNFSGFDPGEWPAMAAWMSETFQKFGPALKPALLEVAAGLSFAGESEDDA